METGDVLFGGGDRQNGVCERIAGYERAVWIRRHADVRIDTVIRDRLRRHRADRMVDGYVPIVRGKGQSGEERGLPDEARRPGIAYFGLQAGIAADHGGECLLVGRRLEI